MNEYQLNPVQFNTKTSRWSCFYLYICK